MSDFCYRWPVLARVAEHAALMDRMMDAAQIDPVAVVRLDQGATWYEARTRCLECHAAIQCRTWLEGAAENAVAVVPPFCANQKLFAQVAGNDAAGEAGAEAVPPSAPPSALSARTCR